MNNSKQRNYPINYTEQILPCEALSSSAGQKIFPAFVQPQDSLTFLQQSVTSCYPVSHKSNLHFPILFLYEQYLTLYRSMLPSEEASFLQFFHLKFCNHFLSSSYRIRFFLVSCCNFKAKTDTGIIPRYVYLF